MEPYWPYWYSASLKSVAIPLLFPLQLKEQSLRLLPLKTGDFLTLRPESHIQAVDAWNLSRGSRDIVVAVIDTGIDVGHPDLKRNIWKKSSGKSRLRLTRQNRSLDSQSHLRTQIYRLQQQIRRMPVKTAQQRMQRNRMQARYRDLLSQHQHQQQVASFGEYGWDFVSRSANPLICTDTALMWPVLLELLSIAAKAFRA